MFSSTICDVRISCSYSQILGAADCNVFSAISSFVLLCISIKRESPLRTLRAKYLNESWRDSGFPQQNRGRLLTFTDRNMAARQEGTRDRAFGFSPDTQNKAGCFRDFLQEVIAKITGENLKAMKRCLRDVISMKVGVNCNSADELVEKLLSCHCLSEYDLDLLEDLLGVTGRSDILDLLREYKRKWPPVVESTSEKAIRELVAGKIN